MSDSGIKMSFKSFVSDVDGNRVQIPKKKRPKPENAKKYFFFHKKNEAL